MVVVGVGKEQPVEVGDFVMKSLLTKVGADVDEERFAANLDKPGGAEPFILFTFRGANRASASDDRNTGGGPCT